MIQGAAARIRWTPLKAFLKGCAARWPFPVRARLRDGQVLHVDLRSSIGRGILATGEFDPRVFEPIAGVLGEGDTFIDVGANVGYYSVLASGRVGPGGAVHAIEIDPRPIRCLRKTIRLLRAGNLHLHECAAGEAEAVLPFSLGTDCGHSRLGGKGRVRRVRVRPLDQMVAIREGSVLRAIKLDIEGAELPALKGAMNLVERWRPLLVIECDEALQSGFGYGTADLMGYLAHVGYRVEWLAGTHSPTIVARHPLSGPR